MILITDDDMLSWAIIHKHPSDNAYNNVVKTIINHPSGNGLYHFIPPIEGEIGDGLLLFSHVLPTLYTYEKTHNYYVYHYEPESSSIKFPDILLMRSFPGPSQSSHATIVVLMVFEAVLRPFNRAWYV